MADEQNSIAPRYNSRPLAIGMAFVAGLVRLIPHGFNFTPLQGLGLFGGARLPLWQALTLPLAVMAVTDVIIWRTLRWQPFHLYVYGSLMLSVLLGRLLARTSSPLRIGAVTLVASLQFFVITNFPVWAGSRVDPATLPEGAAYEVTTDPQYPYPVIRYADSPKGLAACYWLGLGFVRVEGLSFAWPFGFFGNLVVGDLLFVTLLFGGHAWLSALLLRRRPAPVPAASMPH